MTLQVANATVRMVGVRSVAVWTAECGSPRAELLPPGQRRRCSLLTRIVAEVVAELGQRGLAIAEAPLVCGTGLGEIATTAALLEQMHSEAGGLSPIRFAGSVHNTAIGQLAIAIGHRGRSSAVSAGVHTLAISLLEAIGLFADDATDVAVVLADEPLPPPLQPAYDGLAVALHLVRDPGPGDVLLVGPSARKGRDVVDVRVPAAIAGNPCAAAFRLAHAIREGLSGPEGRDDNFGLVALEPVVGDQSRTALCVDLRGPQGVA